MANLRWFFIAFLALAVMGCAGEANYRMEKPLPDGTSRSLHAVYFTTSLTTPSIVAVYGCVYPIREPVRCIEAPTILQGRAASDFFTAAMMTGGIVYGLGNQSTSVQ